MIRNIITLAYRYLIKYKSHTLLNIGGLAVGFTAFILVSLFINYEYSWDKHNVNYNRIYRVQRHYVKAMHAMDGNDISQSKPDPEVFVLAGRRLGVAPENCLVVEDAEAGIEAALAAGMRVLAVGSAAQSLRPVTLRATSLAEVSVADILYPSERS